MRELAILIPTLDRADRLQALLDGIHATTYTPHWVYFIAEKGDVQTLKTCLSLDGGGFTLKFGEYGSCARAMNAGFDGSHERYAFTGNDDLAFETKGWDVPAIEALEEPGKHICGTNDGHGRMTCFAMVRRSYIVRHSGVFDKPATLYHDYASQYVDTELADYAKARGVWTEAPEAIVAHRHPEFGEGDANHPNYVKARGTVGIDYDTYCARRGQWEASLS